MNARQIAWSRRGFKTCLTVLLLCTSILTFSQSKFKVSGKVLNEKKDPIVGASVTQKISPIGTTTDANGIFTIEASKGAKIVVSHIGYNTQEIVVSNKNDLLSVQLSPLSNYLNDIVVIGYGTQKKVSTTAAVASLKTDEIKNAPSANITNLLNGRLPGIIAAQNGGRPGGDAAEIHIRGIATTGNSSALLIVDGVPRDFSSLDPNTIESFSVLKDAAAVAPYGMSGANGVILVTTKKGASGKPTLSYNSYIGIQNPTTVVSLVNSYDYVKLRNIADINSGQAATFSQEQVEGFKKSSLKASDADYDKYPNTNVIDRMNEKNTPITRQNIAVSGGSESIKYYVGLGYLYQQGLWKTIKNNRYNLVSNIETKPTKTTSVSLSINGYNNIVKSPQSELNFALYSLWQPINALDYLNGYYAYNNGNLHQISLLPLRNLGSRVFDETTVFTQLSIQQEIPFLRGLNIKGVVSYDPSTYYIKNWTEPYPTTYNITTLTQPYLFTPIIDPGKPSLYEESRRGKSYTYQAFLNYHRIFGNHDISGLAVMEVRKSSQNFFSASISNYELNIPEINVGNSDPSNWGTSGSSSQTAQVGYVYRATYNYDSRYMFEAAGRYDGHYYFAPGKKYGFFPAFSLGWRISKEKFLHANNWLNDLKVRASWGESGNLAGGPFQYSNSMGLLGSAYVFNNNVVQGAFERLEANPNITWERATKTNIGLDATLWHGLLSFEGNYFYEKRNNMLVSPNSIVPAEYGIAIAQINAGIMSNKGFDLLVNTSFSFFKEMRVSLSSNLTYAKNKLIQIYENEVTLNDPNRSRTGRALNTQFGLKSLGLYQETDFDANGILKAGPIPTFGNVAPGDIKYEDINGDGKITSDDEVQIGLPILPQIIYGFSTNVSYKGFELIALFQGAAHSNLLVDGELVWPFFTGATATEVVAADFWTPENKDARYPRLYGQGGNNNNQQRSSFWMRNSSYLRLKTAEFAYTLPIKTYSKSIGIQSIRIYFSGQNLLTWSPIKEFIDPEMGEQGGRGLSSNSRGWYYPHQKVISFGMNIIF